MAFIIKDRVKEATTTTGTGAISLSGAAATFDSFSSYMSNGDTTYYAIVHTSTGVDEWEVGIGTWNTGNTLTRTTVLAGSNGTSAQSFSADTKDIFMTYPAAKAVYTNVSGGIDINGGTIDGATIGAVTASSGNFTTGDFTGDVDIDGKINIGDYADFDAQSSHPSHREGRLWYDNIHKTLNYHSEDSNVVHELGVEEHARVYNNSGATISKGKPVYFSGSRSAGGTHVPTIALANATEETKYKSEGMSASSIPNNSYGYIVTAGLLDGIDTSHLSVGQVFTGITDGATQTMPPVYPNFPMCLGFVVKVDSTEGVIFLAQQNHSIKTFRVQMDQHIGGDLTIDGNLNVTGTTSSTSTSDVTAGAPFYRANEGDAIGEAGTTFTGTGLDDAFFSGHYTGTATITYDVKIDGVGSGTGGVDTFAVSRDGFVTTFSSANNITGNKQLIHSGDNIYVEFGATTGHTLNDNWEGTASPVNVDSGFWTNRNTGTSGVGYTHMGIWYDASSSKWYLTNEYDPVPAGAIDRSHSSYAKATLDANIEGNVTGNVTGNLTGNATSATALETARTIGGVSFDGSANINLPGVNASGTQDTSGNADTATALETSRTISLTGDVTGSATFDGSANATITAVVQDDSHSHVISNVDGLQTALDAKTPTARTITSGNGLTGGGNLTANRTLNVGAGGGIIVGADTVSHADTSSQASVNNSSGTVIQDIILDTYGHITGIASTNLDGRYYTETEADSRFVNVTGDTMTGNLTVQNGSPRVLLTETGVTNTPTWWSIADGGNYNIRLNNTGVYPLDIVTNSTNDAVIHINVGYNTNFAAGIDVTGNITTTGTVDGVDIAARNGTLTNTTNTANAALPKAGGTVTGSLIVRDNVTLGNPSTTDTGTLILTGSTANKQATLKCTTGNLHMDAETGSNIYLNYFEGNAVIFGSGASGAVATMTSTGNLTLNGTVDGRDVATDGTKLDTIATNANNYSFPYTVSASAGNSTVVQRNGSGYIFANYLNTTANDVSSGVTKVMVETGNDNYIRHGSAAAVRSFINVENGATADQTKADIDALNVDADTLDGIHASSFLRSNVADTASGDLTLGVVNITNEVRFPNNTSLTDVSLTGVSDADTGFNWSGANAVNYVSGGVLKYNLNNVWHSGNDGSGSGLDADLLDGLHASSFATSAQGTLATNALPKAGGTVTGTFTLSQDAGDVLNFSANSTNDNRGIAFNSRTALSADYNDGWLRLNQGSEFTNGVYTPLHLRVDGNLDVTSSIRHVGDTDTYMQFEVADHWRVVTGGTERLEVNNTTMTVANTLSMNAHEIDMNNNNIVGVNRLTHEGDSNTYIEFHTADQFRVVVGGSERFESSAVGCILSGTFTNVTGDLVLPSKIIHTDDTDTYTQFHEANQWRVVTGGGERLEVNSTNTTVLNNLKVDRINANSGQQLVLNAGETPNFQVSQTTEKVYINAEGGLQVNSSPDNWGAAGWAGRNQTTICDASGNSSFDGSVTATSFIGNGSALTGISGGDTISAVQLSAYYDPAATSASPGPYMVTIGALNDWLMVAVEVTAYTVSLPLDQGGNVTRYKFRKKYRSFS